MATGRRIRGVLDNFLGTFTSRYSDHDGYWLFGLVIPEITMMTVDLLSAPDDATEGLPAVAANLARAKFEDQLRKSGLEQSQLAAASLMIHRDADAVKGSVNGNPAAGYRVGVTAAAVLRGGRRHARERVLFVAPHNPEVEYRSARAEVPPPAA
jgi:hypothetical protein